MQKTVLVVSADVLRVLLYYTLSRWYSRDMSIEVIPFKVIVTLH